MARLVVVGHGGFDTLSEFILVPPATTITFMADAGSELALPVVAIGTPPADAPVVEGQHYRFDYEKVAGVLDHFAQTEPPRREREGMPNISIEQLGAESQRIAKELEAQGKWGGELITKTGKGLLHLCEGDDSKCPSPMLVKAETNHQFLIAMDQAKQDEFQEWVKAGATGDMPAGFPNFEAPGLSGTPDLYYKYVVEGVPEGRWHHDCTGIFGKTVGEGKDIIWLSCSGFVADKEDLKAIGLKKGLPKEMTQATRGPDIQWTPDAAALKRIADLNGQKVKDTPDGASIRIRAGGVLVLVGDDHENNVENYMKSQGDLGDLAEGKLTVKKGGAFSKGTITVDNIPTAKQASVTDAIAKFSDKKVVFS
jgi:hypothetical protein